MSIIISPLPLLCVLVVFFSYGDLGYFFDFVGDILISIVIGLVVLLILQIVKVIICKLYEKVELVVTDKRIYGCAFFGRQVDLPLDSISTVALFFKNGIAISTASGRIIFGGMKNRTELYHAISNLLVSRQEKGGQFVQQTISTSNADELKKYKELLDSGVITQEEFDSKKKQLLDN
ncbi:MAG: SHOCT domain-containing protein [Oscillospiraceae bacterium]|nr:SHOCT domain-containing protein [Oscillospiraceae bacterium]